MPSLNPFRRAPAESPDAPAEYAEAYYEAYQRAYEEGLAALAVDDAPPPARRRLAQAQGSRAAAERGGPPVTSQSLATETRPAELPRQSQPSGTASPRSAEPDEASGSLPGSPPPSPSVPGQAGPSLGLWDIARHSEEEGPDEPEFVPWSFQPPAGEGPVVTQPRGWRFEPPETQPDDAVGRAESWAQPRPQRSADSPGVEELLRAWQQHDLTHAGADAGVDADADARSDTARDVGVHSRGDTGQPARAPSTPSTPTTPPRPPTPTTPSRPAAHGDDHAGRGGDSVVPGFEQRRTASDPSRPARRRRSPWIAVLALIAVSGLLGVLLVRLLYLS